MSKSLCEDNMHPLSMSSFLVGPCSTCAVEKVLTVKRWKGDDLVEACFHCETVMTGAELTWIGPRELLRLGYSIVGLDDEGCDSHGGCRGRECGVRQPAG